MRLINIKYAIYLCLPIWILFGAAPPPDIPIVHDHTDLKSRDYLVDHERVERERERARERVEREREWARERVERERERAPKRLEREPQRFREDVSPRPPMAVEPDIPPEPDPPDDSAQQDE